MLRTEQPLFAAGRQTVDIQCRPCGNEWEPCCADLSGLCSDGFICYAEQDRCVVSEYVGIRESFFPSGAVCRQVVRAITG